MNSRPSGTNFATSSGMPLTRLAITGSSMLMASIILVAHGMVEWVLFLPLVLGRITGALIGSEIVMHTRNRKLAFVFAVVVILMAIRTLFN